MMKLFHALLVGSLAVAGCDRLDVVKHEERRPALAAPTACVAAPALALSPDFEDPRKVFGPGSKAFDSTRANFAAAYQRSCQNGLLRDEALVDAEASDKARLFLHNAPEANVTSIYLSGYDSPAGTPRLMLVESTFLTEDGTNVPSVEDLEEAIYCKVKGATPKEQEETGRCLPD